ncbi:MAG TPA: hypothetical protein VNL18_12535, partial [Gemmatimonadales bacterium]|nr:hypothetical protein [Gemmatimonadales bacterium]
MSEEVFADYVVCAVCASDDCEHTESPLAGLERYRVDVEVSKSYRFDVLAESAEEAEAAAEEAFEASGIKSEPDNEETFFHVRRRVMNYYEARQVDPNADRYDAGRWRYTCRNGGRVWPVGRCRDCPGHRTREEAEAHQREFDLEHATFHVHLEKPWGRCKR